uniref:Uncharacterized protein n=1 Tax=Heterorhabditis bacteriophora TaxID=37862 RepID=A0A1I7WKU7_HETBA
MNLLLYFSIINMTKKIRKIGFRKLILIINIRLLNLKIIKIHLKIAFFYLPLLYFDLYSLLQVARKFYA